jgi:hypothetical protein
MEWSCAKGGHADLSLDELLDDVCGFLNFNDEWSEKVKTRANEFFEEQLLGSTLAVLQTVTESMLVQAKLRVLCEGFASKGRLCFFIVTCHNYSQTFGSQGGHLSCLGRGEAEEATQTCHKRATCSTQEGVFGRVGFGNVI